MSNKSEEDNNSPQKSEEQIEVTKKTEDEQQEQVEYQLDEDEYLRLIAPWEPFYDKTWQRIYYFNKETQESLWDLPEQIQQNIAQYQIQHPTTIAQQTGAQDLLALNQQQQEQIQGSLAITQQQDWKAQPARKQVEQSLAQNFSYRQGDEIYNIWYSKFLGAEAPETPADRQAATTRCDPELDQGYTKSKNSKQSFFCIHFARGCCSEGANCHYHHHVPEFKECEQIEASKDIFGRQRFAGFRDDMMGVGSFLKEIRSLQVMGWSGDAEGLGLQEVVKEQLWRHFGVFGEIEDVKVMVAKGHAFVRFKHRCMAEFAKEAMMLRALDNNEILVIKWANEENSEEQAIRVRQEEEKSMKEAIYKKQKREEGERKIIQQQLMQDKKNKESILAESEYFQSIQLEKQKKQQEYFRNISAMNEVLNKIEQGKSEKEKIQTGVSEFNDLPLHFK